MVTLPTAPGRLGRVGPGRCGSDRSGSSLLGTSVAAVNAPVPVSGIPLAVEGLRCHYGTFAAVDGVSFAVRAGEKVALLGANGSGKSTLLRAISGLHEDYQGRILVADTTVTPKLARQRCAWVPQRQIPGRFPLLVSELLDSSGNSTAAREACESLGLTPLLRRPLSTLSGGQLQRCFLARALGSLHDGSRVLLADEPSAALDFDGQAEIGRLLAGLDVTALIATHDRNMAALCDRRFEMAAGRLREIP